MTDHVRLTDSSLDFQIDSSDSSLPSEQTLIVETSPTVESIDEFVSDGTVRFALDADAQHHLIRRVTPIQSATYDARISVSERPQATIMFSTLLQRETERTIQQEFSSYRHFNGGDQIDTSNDPEWMLTLSASTDENAFEHIFGLQGSSEWNDEQWIDYLDRLDDLDFESYMEGLLAYYQETGEVIAPAAQGNHDGGAWGNGVERTRPLLQLEAEVVRYTAQRTRMEAKLERLEDLLASGIRSHSRRLKIEGKVASIRGELEHMTDLVESSMAERDAEQKSLFYSTQRAELARQLELLERRADRRSLKPERIERLQLKIAKIKRRIEFLDQRVEVATFERDRAKARSQKLSFGERINPLRFFTDVFIGVSRRRPLRDPNGYWAQNAGSVELTFDKKDYLESYLNARYPEFSNEALQALITPARIDIENEDERLVAQRSDLFFASMHSADLDVLPDEALIEGGRQLISGQSDFNSFWREVRPGEFVAAVDLSGNDFEGAHRRYILVQAFYLGEVNGRPVYMMVQDGMDGTENEIDIAYFSEMSGAQKQICDLFIDEMINRHGESVMIPHLKHTSLRDHFKKGWNDAGWPEYYARPQVVPFVFNGHGHRRAVYDETKRTLFGAQLFIGKRPIKNRDQFFSIMTPSTTDAPNEFMTVDLGYDPDRQTYFAQVEYQPVISEQDEREFDPRVMQAVEDLRSYFRHNAYHEYSGLRTGLFPGLRNIFFSQDRILIDDAIPSSVGRFNESIWYAKTYLDLLTEQFGEEDAFVRVVQRTYRDLREHYDRWYYGDPAADNEYDRKGYLAATQEAEGYSRRDRIALLRHYNDIFDTPSYERLMLLISQTPEFGPDTENPGITTRSLAYDFGIALAREAAREELGEVKEKHPIPDVQRFEFDMPLTSISDSIADSHP